MFHIMCQLRFGAAPDDWRWRTNEGARVHPKNMDTRHLFYTTRLIWNTVVAPDFPVGYVSGRAFGRRYTPEILREAMLYCAAELCNRDDLEPRQEGELALMGKFVSEGKVKLSGG